MKRRGTILTFICFLVASCMVYRYSLGEVYEALYIAVLSVLGFGLAGLIWKLRIGKV